jgi:hypothetical protein
VSVFFDPRPAVAVASFNPFWRYAVALDHRPDLPAIPYWSRAAADVFAADYERQFPGRKATILRRRRWRRVEVAL